MEWHADAMILKSNLEKSLENLISWLTKSGLKVDESKTEICLFTRTNIPSIIIKVSGQDISSIHGVFCGIDSVR